MEKKLLQTTELVSQQGTEYKIEYWAGEVAEVTILDWPSNALETLARATRGYLGNYSNEPISQEEKDLFAVEIMKTKLSTPVEFLNFVFLIRDVPRSFTHQLVRTRIGAAVVQESTRFLGVKNTYKILVPKTAHNGMTIDTNYVVGNQVAIDSYVNMLETPGIHSQDARQLLPHSILTSLFWSINMKALQVVYNQRWCCAAEPSSWLPVMRQCKQSIIDKCGEDIGGLLTAPIDRGQPCGFDSKVLDKECFWRPRMPEYRKVLE
jgi:thymidylate synthase (FAD)